MSAYIGSAEASGSSGLGRKKDFVIFHTEGDTKSADIIRSYLLRQHFTEKKPDTATKTDMANLDDVIEHCSNYILVLSKDGLNDSSLVFEMHVSMSTIISTCNKTKRMIPVLLPSVTRCPPTLRPYQTLDFDPEKGSEQDSRFWEKLEFSMRKNMQDV